MILAWASPFKHLTLLTIENLVFFSACRAKDVASSSFRRCTASDNFTLLVLIYFTLPETIFLFWPSCLSRF